MYRLKSKTLGYLREVEPPLPDHLLRGLDLHAAEIVHDTVTGLLMKQLLQLAAADHVIAANLGYGERLIQPLLQIADDALQIVAECRGRKNGRLGERVSLPQQMNEKFLQRADQKLFAADGGIGAALQRVDGGVIEGRGKGGLTFFHQTSQQNPLGRAGKREPVTEKLHRRTAAVKADHDQIGGGNTVGRQSVELTGGMKNDLPAGQGVLPFSGDDADGSLVYIDKLPEVVGLTGKGIAAGVFKVVYRKEGVDPDDPLGMNGGVCHSFAPGSNQFAGMPQGHQLVERVPCLLGDFLRDLIAPFGIDIDPLKITHHDIDHFFLTQTLSH